MKQFRAVVIEDEELQRASLIKKIQDNCPNIEIVGECASGLEALEKIPELSPHLVFLDVRLETISGLDVLNRLPQINFEIIFTTEFSEYAIEAIRKDAIDYIIKPIDEAELSAAVKKATDKIKKNQKHLITRIIIPVKNGYRYVGVDEIIYCEADDNRTIFHLYNGKTIRTSRTLRQVENRLESPGFIRIHRSYLIHIEYTEVFSREDGGYVIMSNEDRLPVSRNNFHKMEGLL